MADVQVTSATLENGTLTVSGSGFTRTTTTVTVDGEGYAFTVNDDGTEITAHEVPSGAEEVEVSKGEITQTATIDGDDAEEPAKTAEPNTTPGDVTKDDQTADVSAQDLATANNAGADYKTVQPEQSPAPGPNPGTAQNPQEKVEPLGEGEHLPGSNFRARVENTAAGDLNMDPREPYPTGNPPDPEDVFERLHGYRRGEGGEKEAQLDADPKT